MTFRCSRTTWASACRAQHRAQRAAPLRTAAQGQRPGRSALRPYEPLPKGNGLGVWPLRPYEPLPKGNA